MGIACVRPLIFLGILSILMPCVSVNVARAQGIQQSPYSAPSLLRGLSTSGLDLAPSNPLGLPGSSVPGAGGSGCLHLSDGMLRGILPLIPNLQFGYLYDYGNNRVSSGRFTADYLLPFTLSADSMIFGEAHTEFQDFWKTPSFDNRVDMSFGGGFRTFLKRGALVGGNGFYDTSRLGGTWYSSGGLGFEMAALIGSDALDFNFNWYGQLFNSTVIRNAFRYGPSNFDFQAGYSHELWNGGPDLRLSATGYKFDTGSSVYGWNGGAELWSRDAVFVLRYRVGRDQLNETYQEVGGFVNIGFQLENIFRGESPFTKPEPIFKSPRTLRYMLTQPVRRDWHQPAAVVLAKQGGIGGIGSITATATGFGTIPPLTTVGVPLTPSVALPDTSAFSSLTVTFSSPSPPGGGGVALITDTAQIAGFVSFGGGVTSVTILKAANPRFFGGGGITGTVYNFVNVANDDAANLWTPGLVTFVWQ